MDLPRTQELLRRVARREGLARWIGKSYGVFLVLAGLYALLLLLARAGVLPDLFGPATLAAPPLLALLVGRALVTRPTTVAAARLLDQRLHAHDLFLTAALLDAAGGALKPLVAAAAESRAAAVRAAAVVPFRWWPAARNVAAALVILIAGGAFLPGFDLFGRDEGSPAERCRRQQLAALERATRLRVEILKKEAARARASEIERSLAEVTRALKAMRPGRRQETRARLQGLEQPLAQTWRRMQAELRRKLALASGPQQLGAGAAGRARQWKEQLQRGDASALRKELEELKELARKLAGTTDAAARRKLLDELEERLEGLRGFAAREMQSPPLTEALARALEELDLARVPGFESEALAALAGSLDLAGLELADLGEGCRSLADLERALEALRLARLAAELGILDELGDWEDLEQFLAACRGCLAKGRGLPGAPPGGGGPVPEDETAETAFKSQRSRTALRAGKLLLRWKTRGVGPAGEIKKDYQDLLREVRQGVSEAVLQERIPPGYHRAIQKYFDAIGQGGAKKPAGR